jgi:hypothetical protein
LTISPVGTSSCIDFGAFTFFSIWWIICWASTGSVA